MLELSRDKEQYQLKAINLNQVANEAIKTVEPLANLRKINIASSLENTMIMGEREALRRAITIILDNAIKYSKDKTKITVNSTISGRQVILKIKDQGTGIDQVEIPLIFNRFYRSDKARTSDGHGQGLSIAKKITTAHEGIIEIESRKGKGTTVSLTFPYSARIQN